MKKIFGLLFLVLLINSCDDGDANVTNVTFDETDAANCGQLIYRITENRVMILKITALNLNLFVNDQTLEGNPRIAEIPLKATVTYREYDGALDGNTLCASPPPLTPVATVEWQASEGTVEVTTTAVPSAPNSETGATTISRYRHLIVYKNLKFIKPDGTTQTYPEYVFGYYYTTATNLPMTFDPDDVEKCTNKNLIYNAQTSGATGLYIDNYSGDMLSTNNLDVPRSFPIGETDNAVIYKLLESSIPTTPGNANYFCVGSDTPAVKEQWNAVSGTIEVTTTSISPNFLHTIRLKNVTFKKGNTTFYYGNDILYGNLLAQP